MPKRKQVKEEDVEEEQDEQLTGASGSPSDSDSDDEFPSGADSDEESSSDDEDGEAFDQVDVDFEFYDPAEKDFHGLKTLLAGLLDGAEWDSSELVDAIIKQSEETGVGTVIKCGEEEGPIGVCTALSLPTQRARLRSLGQLRDYLLGQLPDAGSKARLEAAWDAPGTALVINERLINCPPQLAPPLAEALASEVAAAAGDEDLSREQRSSFAFKQYLMLVRAYTDPLAAAGQQQGGGGKKQKKKQKGGGGEAAAAPPALVHVLPEAEAYQSVADWVLSFPTPGRLVAKDDLQQCRVLMLVKAPALPKARAVLAQLLGGGE